VTRDAYKQWNQQDIAFVVMHLHESHDEGGFVVPNNTIMMVLLGTPNPVGDAKLPAQGPHTALRLLLSACHSTVPAAVHAGCGAAANAGANPQLQHAVSHLADTSTEGLEDSHVLKKHNSPKS
jgi:hypothetical protein